MAKQARGTASVGSVGKEYTLEGALMSVLITSPNDRAKWRQVDLNDDADIVDMLGDLLGARGRSSSKAGICGIIARPAPKFWFGTYQAQGKATLEGSALVAKVREVLTAPTPDDREPALPGAETEPVKNEAAPAVNWEPSGAGVSGSFRGTVVRAHVAFDTETLWLEGPTGQVIARNVEEAGMIYQDADWPKELERALAMKPAPEPETDGRSLYLTSLRFATYSELERERANCTANDDSEQLALCVAEMNRRRVVALVRANSDVWTWVDLAHELGYGDAAINDAIDAGEIELFKNHLRFVTSDVDETMPEVEDFDTLSNRIAHARSTGVRFNEGWAALSGGVAEKAAATTDAFEQQVDAWLDESDSRAEFEPTEEELAADDSASGMKVLSETGVHTIERSFLSPSETAQLEQLAFKFDFTGLDDDDTNAIQQRTIEIRDCFKRGYELTAEIGDKLRDVKRRLTRGKWEEYLRQEFQMSRDTGDRLIEVKELAEKDPHFAENLFRIPRTVQYLIAKASTPEEARGEIIERAASGEEMPTAKAQTIVDRHKPPAEEPEAELVLTGRTQEDLLQILKANAMQIEELVEMGFTPGVIDRALQERLIDKTIKGKCSYTWTVADVVAFVTEQGTVSRGQFDRAGCTQVSAILEAERGGLIVKANGMWSIPSAGRKAGSESRATSETSTPARPSAPPLGSGVGGNARPESPIADLLKGRALSVTFSWIPQMPGLVTIGVCVGDDRSKMASATLEASKVRGFPDAVHDLIAKQLAGAVKSGASAVTGSAQKAAGIRKSAAKNKPAAKKRAAIKKPARSGLSAKYMAQKQKSGGKKPAAKKKGAKR